jgi:hypothetical protein
MCVFYNAFIFKWVAIQYERGKKLQSKPRKKHTQNSSFRLIDAIQSFINKSLKEFSFVH